MPTKTNEHAISASLKHSLGPNAQRRCIEYDAAISRRVKFACALCKTSAMQCAKQTLTRILQRALPGCHLLSIWYSSINVPAVHVSCMHIKEACQPQEQVLMLDLVDACGTTVVMPPQKRKPLWKHCLNVASIEGISEKLGSLPHWQPQLSIKNVMISMHHTQYVNHDCARHKPCSLS